MSINIELFRRKYLYFIKRSNNRKIKISVINSFCIIIFRKINFAYTSDKSQRIKLRTD